MENGSRLKLLYNFFNKKNFLGDVAAVEQEANAGNVNALNDLGQNTLHVAIERGNQYVT